MDERVNLSGAQKRMVLAMVVQGQKIEEELAQHRKAMTELIEMIRLSLGVGPGVCGITQEGEDLILCRHIEETDEDATE